MGLPSLINDYMKGGQVTHEAGRNVSEWFAVSVRDNPHNYPNIFPPWPFYQHNTVADSDHCTYIYIPACSMRSTGIQINH
jgi:hypothetical protein